MPESHSGTSSGTINGVPFSVPEGYEVVSRAEWDRGRKALQLLSDLDRSQVGRHRGDVESQAPTGVSQGNPLLPPGTHIGYTIDGWRRIVVPENTADVDAWFED